MHRDNTINVGKGILVNVSGTYKEYVIDSTLVNVILPYAFSNTTIKKLIIRGNVLIKKNAFAWSSIKKIVFEMNEPSESILIAHGSFKNVYNLENIWFNSYSIQIKTRSFITTERRGYMREEIITIHLNDELYVKNKSSFDQIFSYVGFSDTRGSKLGRLEPFYVAAKEGITYQIEFL